MGYFDLECVEKSHSPAGKVNGMCENMSKTYKYGQKSLNMDKNMYT